MKKVWIYFMIAAIAVPLFGQNETPGQNSRPKTFAGCDLARWDFSGAEEEVWRKYVVGHQHYRLGTIFVDAAKDCSEGGAGIWKFFQFISANAYDVMWISSHGLSAPKLVVVYLDTTAACRTARDSLYNRYNTTFPGCLDKVRFTSKRYGIVVNQKFFKNYLMTPDAFLWGSFCHSSKFTMTGTAEARDYVANTNAVYVSNSVADQEYVLNRMDGQQGQDKRPLQVAIQGYANGSPVKPRNSNLVRFGPGNTVLSPSVLVNLPIGIVCDRTPGYVKFDCIMETKMPPDIVIRATGGGHLENQTWAGNDKIEYEVVPDVPPPFTIKYTVNSIYAVSRDNWSDLDGNLNPAGSNARGPNWDNFVWYTYCPITPWVPVLTPPDTFWIDIPDTFSYIPVSLVNPTDSMQFIIITWVDSLMWMAPDTLEVTIPPATDTLLFFPVSWPGWVLDWDHIWFNLWNPDWVFLGGSETWASPMSPLRVRPVEPPGYLWTDSFFDVYVSLQPAYDGPIIQVQAIPWFENPLWPDAVVDPPGYNPVPDSGMSFRISFPAIGEIDYPAESFFDVFLELLPGLTYNGTHLGKFNVEVGPPMRISNSINTDYFPVETEIISLNLVSMAPLNVIINVDDTYSWTTLLGDSSVFLPAAVPVPIDIEVFAQPVGFELFNNDILGSSQMLVSLRDSDGHGYYVQREFTLNCLNPLVLLPVCDTYDQRSPAGSNKNLEWMVTNRSGVDWDIQVNVFDLLMWPTVFYPGPFTLDPAESLYLNVVADVPVVPVGTKNEVTLFVEALEDFRISRQGTLGLRVTSDVLICMEGQKYYFSSPGDVLSFDILVKNLGPDDALVSMEGFGELGTVIGFDPSTFELGWGDSIFVTVTVFFDPGLPAGVATLITMIANAYSFELALPASDTTYGEVYMEMDVRLDEKPTVPINFELKNAVPNPFNSSVTIGFAVPENSTVTIDVFNTLGDKITTLVDGNYSAGIYRAVWNTASDRKGNLTTGVYLYRMRAGDYEETKTMIFIK
ncbi:MAG: T9SS type A sorting domain-containing protein [Acidobacteria bacterium]|nr:T9SS type A sorting domain-containing protein [Acidobacteriota bacterium]